MTLSTLRAIISQAVWNRIVLSVGDNAIRLEQYHIDSIIAKFLVGVDDTVLRIALRLQSDEISEAEKRGLQYAYDELILSIKVSVESLVQAQPKPDVEPLVQAQPKPDVEPPKPALV